MRVYGIATQATSWLVLDGVVATDAGQTGGGGSYFDYASFEEARMQTIANDVETPNRGINLNLIVKSGGNDFHGDASWEQTSGKLAASNLDDDAARAGHQAAQLPQAPVLWWRGHRRPHRSQQAVVLQRGAWPAEFGEPLWAWCRRTARLASSISRNSWSPTRSPIRWTRSHRFIWFDYYQRLIKDDPVTVDQGYETKQNNFQPQHTMKLEWQAVKGNSLVASLQVSRWRVPRHSEHSGNGSREDRHRHQLFVWN